jgi:NAD(P)-dependent dehydrogenase (short-subunit alcohol dehydrogenase family)
LHGGIIVAVDAMTGRVVVVTGGARGLGRGLVDAFAANGDRVVTCGRNQPEDDDLPATFIVCDVRDADQVARFVDEVADRFGALDVLVNNAGGTPYAPAATMSPRLFERIVALNLVAPFYVAQRANAVMQAQADGGVILNIGSAGAIRPAPQCAPYNSAKAGLAVLTRSLAMEWAPKVRVNQISVGLLQTERLEDYYGIDVAAVDATVPMGRMATAADVGAMCILLASPAAGYMTGADVLLDGGGEEPAFLHAVVRPDGAD